MVSTVVFEGLPRDKADWFAMHHELLAIQQQRLPSARHATAGRDARETQQISSCRGHGDSTRMSSGPSAPGVHPRRVRAYAGRDTRPQSNTTVTANGANISLARDRQGAGLTLPQRRLFVAYEFTNGALTWSGNPSPTHRARFRPSPRFRESVRANPARPRPWRNHAVNSKIGLAVAKLAGVHMERPKNVCADDIPRDKDQLVGKSIVDIAVAGEPKPARQRRRPASIWEPS